MASSGVPHLVDDLFRRSHGEIVAVLSRRLGGARLDLVEEAVQEAFLRALRIWPFRGVPENPRGWLYRVALRRALDRVSRERRRATLLAEVWTVASAAARDSLPSSLPEPDRIADDELALLLLSCHPALSRPSRVVLTLKVGCGFSVREIGALLLVAPSAVAQRIVRAKRTLRSRGLDPPVPTEDLLHARAPVLREVIYLMFSGGHTAVEGEALFRPELCAEAVRLTELMLRHPGGEEPATHALAALMSLHAARLAARVDDDGLLVPLDEQDRSRWDRSLLARGFHHLERAAAGPVETRYHIEAAIACVHALAPSAAETDWPRLVELYDALMACHSSPVVALNRAVAVGRAVGPEAGLAAAREAAQDPALASYHLRAAVVGDLLEMRGDRDGAASAFREALTLGASAPEQAYLRRRLERIVTTRT